MIRPFRLFTLIAIFLCISACANPNVDMGTDPVKTQPSDYSKHFKTWSREIHVLPIDGFENVLTARATYLSYRFREAYISKVSHDLDYSLRDRELLTTSEIEDLNKGHEFFISVMSAVKKCDNLDPKDGPWTIRLKNDKGLEVSATSVTKIEKPMPDHIKYFFFNPSFRNAYRIVFPFKTEKGELLISNNAKYFILSFATAYGRSSARWNIAN